MSEELDEIRRHNRKILGLVFILFLLCLLGVGVSYFSKPQVKNYIGKNGSNGISIKGDLGNQGLQGVQGVQGLQGTQGIQGITGSQGQPGVQGATGMVGAQGEPGIQGIPGENGQDGKTPEFRCNPKNHDYEWRYVGDEDWQTLETNSQACYQVVL